MFSFVLFPLTSLEHRADVFKFREGEKRLTCEKRHNTVGEIANYF